MEEHGVHQERTGDGIRFSVICPFYNTEQYLKKAAASVIRQSCSSWELILVNDGSTDRSTEIAEECASSDPRIRLLSIAHAGTYHARKAGIDAAQGTYIVFLDSDDCLESTMLETVAGIMEECAAGAVVFNWDRMDSDVPGFDTDDITQKQMLTDCRGILREVFVKHSYGFTLCRTVFRRSLFAGTADSVPVNQRSAEDTYLSYTLFTAMDSALLIPQVLYHYRVNPDSVTRNLTVEDYAGKYRTVLQIFEDIDLRYPGLLEEGTGIHAVRSIFAYVIQVPQINGRTVPYSTYRDHCRMLRESTFWSRHLQACRTGDRKLDLCIALMRRRMYFVLYVLLKGWKSMKG